jgi:hypothetical protein
MIKFLKSILTTIALSTANVEKNLFKKIDNDNDSGGDKEIKHKDNKLADSLLRGEITQEVKNLRWRMYKALTETSKIDSVSFTSDSYQINKTSHSKKLKKVKTDNTDNYPLLMEITVEDIKSDDSVLDLIKSGVKEEIFIDDNTKKEISDINFLELFTNSKSGKNIEIIRENPTKFNIEDFTEKIHIKKIENKTHLIEFYINKYLISNTNPQILDSKDRKQRLLLSEIKKIERTNNINSIDFNGLKFITFKTIGVDDYLLYEYNDFKFNKVTEYVGYYVLKFTATQIISGKYLFEDFVEEELEKKYQNRERRVENNTISFDKL